jgi:hypothetical protein
VSLPGRLESFQSPRHKASLRRRTSPLKPKNGLNGPPATAAPIFTKNVKVGTHAADAGSFILASPRKDNSGSCSTATAAPIFTKNVKVGTHAANAGSFILASPRKDNSGSCSTATAAPTFTKNVKVGQPPAIAGNCEPATDS